MPKKENFSHIPLLEVQITKEFEEELIKTILPYKDKSFSQQHEGKVFREVLQKHIRDSNFPHIIDSPNFRLLPILKNQWLTAKEFYVTVFWLWKQANGELFKQVSDWLDTNHPKAERVYSGDFDKTESVDDTLSKWAGMFIQSAEKIDSVKMTMAVILHSAADPDIFKKFRDEEKKRNRPPYPDEIKCIKS